jgi:YEATS domain-containing protein 4
MAKRMKGITVERPIVVGTVAYWLGKKSDDQKTHKWTAYIRGPNNEDLTYFIKRVVFKLHESFKNPKRGLYYIYTTLIENLMSRIQSF